MNVNTKSTISKAAAIVAVFTLLSRLVGLFRDRLFASTFGAGDTLDSYYVAFRIPDLVYNFLILGTLSVSFIPVFTEYFIKDKEEANKMANTVLTFLFITMSVICIILYFFVPQFTHITAPGFTGQKFANTVLLTKIFLLSPVIFTVASVFSSILNALKRFLIASVAPILYNVGIIVGIKYFYPHYGIRGLAYGVILGALVYLVIQMLGAFSAGFKLRPNFDFDHAGVRKVAKLFLPRILGIDNAQISLLVASIIGSTLLSGTIAVFNLANNLQAVAVGMFGISFAIAAFPDLSETYAKDDHQQFSRILARTVTHVLFFVIPISILILVLRAQIVRLTFGAGKFNWQATILTANTLGIFAFSIFAQSVAPLFSRAFYSRRNTVTPMFIGLLTIVINAAASYLFGRSYGVLGLALGFSLSNVINVGLLYFVLRPQLQHFEEGYVIKSTLKILLASVIAGGAAHIVLGLMGTVVHLDSWVHVFEQGIVAAAAGLAVFAGCAHVLGLSQIKTTFAVVKSRFLR